MSFVEEIEDDTLDISTIDESYDSHSNTLTEDEDEDDDGSSIPTISLLSTQCSHVMLQARLEWINAIFGKEFANAGKSRLLSKKGCGLSDIESYIAYEATIPPIVGSQEKLGITISRIPLGCHVSEVLPGSEADSAGVVAGSVLIEINGVALLGEPTHKALERLWEYDQYDKFTHTHARTHTHVSVCLKLINAGKIYTATLFSREGFGITWAPCGNFALVQRSYSFVQKAGVKRGCLLASVNGKSMRDVDHVGMAELLRALFWKKEPIHLVLVYTPAASRVKRNNPPQLRIKTKAPPNPLKFLQTSCGSSTSVAKSPAIQSNVSASQSQSHSLASSKFAELAQRVAGGETVATHQELKLPPGLPRVHEPLPKLDMSIVFANWTMLNALTYCLFYHTCNYSIDDFITSNYSTKYHAHASFSNLLSQSNATNMCNFLLQIVSFLSSSSCTQTNQKILSETLVKHSLQNDHFCLKLYWLLHSFSDANDAIHVWKDTFNSLQAALQQKYDTMQTQTLSQQSVSTPKIQPLTPVSKESQTLTENNQYNTPPSSPENPIEGTNSSSSTIKKKKNMFSSLRRLRPIKVKTPSKSSNGCNSTPSNKSPSPFPSRPITPAHIPQPILKNYVRDRDTNNISIPTATTSNDESMQVQASSAYSILPCLQNLKELLSKLNTLTDTIESKLRKPFSQKIADFALSDKKQKVLSDVTSSFRKDLYKFNNSTNDNDNDDHDNNNSSTLFPLVNPLDSNQVLSCIEPSECFILPSVHFPILLTFQYRCSSGSVSSNNVTEKKNYCQEMVYKTKVEVLSLRNASTSNNYVVQGTIAGIPQTTEKSSLSPYFESSLHRWYKNNTFTFETRSSWGLPKTLTLKLTRSASTDTSTLDDLLQSDEDVAFGWVNLSSIWNDNNVSSSCSVKLSTNDDEFDQQGGLINNDCHIDRITSTTSSNNSQKQPPKQQQLELEILITTECQSTELQPKCMLLYKRGDDLRQEMMAIQFIEACHELLKASGLDLKMKTFKCLPVGKDRGFIEWLPGCVPLSDVCQGNGTGNNSGSVVSSREGSIDGSTSGGEKSKNDLNQSSSCTTFIPMSSNSMWFNQPFALKGRRLSQNFFGIGRCNNATINNPIQDFLRGVSYDPNAPYFISKIVMDNYIKSCAGYCVTTYLLGVGDRHLDNILLHPDGYFLHCDFSYILGQDPKTYLPMRITEEMVLGMGGQESDNFAKFVNLAGAAFIVLRRHQNLRILLSLIRLLVNSDFPDISVNQSPEDSFKALHYRFRLDLNDDDALSFMEKLIESSISSKLAIAVDAIHSLGKHF